MESGSRVPMVEMGGGKGRGERVKGRRVRGGLGVSAFDDGLIKGISLNLRLVR